METSWRVDRRPLVFVAISWRRFLTRVGTGRLVSTRLEAGRSTKLKKVRWLLMYTKLRLSLGAALMLCLAVVVIPMSADAASKSCDTRVNNTVAKLVECVTVQGVREHQAALQAAADTNGGTRAAGGLRGYTASVDYVVSTMKAAGWKVTLNEFPFTYVALPTLQQTAPVAATYETGIFSGTGFGQVTGQVIPIDLALGNADWPADPSTSTSGCEASDFDGLDFSGPNDIALTQRGTCFFAEKAVNAEAAGAEAIIIFNQGNSPTRLGPVSGNATALPDGSPSNIGIPMAGASFDAGIALSQAGSQALVRVDPPEERPQVNVIAELPSGDPNKVIMVGAHLNSVQQGPGIQDNGSGSATMLEVAQQMAKVKPRNKVRFAWWGAEESGLIGSTAYVNGLSQEELDKIVLYLNFDMIGSPNYVFHIYDGDNSDGQGAGPGPDGSAQSKSFSRSFTRKEASRSRAPTLTDARTMVPSSHLVFRPAVSSPAPRWSETPEEAEIWGGIAGEQYDPCYHLVCDTFDNISLKALDIDADAVAASTLQYAMNTQEINGKRGKGNFKLQNRDFGEGQHMHAHDTME